MGLLICRRMDLLHRTGDLRIARLVGRGFLALGAAAERQIGSWTKTDTSSQNRRRNTVDKKTHLVIPRRMTCVLLPDIETATGYRHRPWPYAFFEPWGTLSQKRERGVGGAVRWPQKVYRAVAAPSPEYSQPPLALVAPFLGPGGPVLRI